MLKHKIIFSYLVLCIPFLATAEEIQIESIQSSEGAGITCSADMKGELKLDIMGEIGKREIRAVEKNQYLYV